MTRSGPRPLRLLSLATVLLAGAAACGRNPRPATAPVIFLAEVREILGTSEPSPEFYRARGRLERMGPEVDAVLVALVRDRRTRSVTRANAMLLLADRRSPAALPVLRRVLQAETDMSLRAAAVQALQRLGTTSDEAAGLLRTAVRDPSRIVRLNALQALDIRDVQTIRAQIRRERDSEVRLVAIQLVALAEARGAPLEADRRGALRTAGTETDPQLVFRPARTDSLAAVSVGDLRVELPNAADIPLAPMAEVVAGVVPAFFAPDRSRVVYEVDREIRVADLRTRTVTTIGQGIAPRPIPFTSQFVFVRSIGGETEGTVGDTELHYEVLRAPFSGEGVVERIGELRALARADRHGNYSPVRWMVVGETPEGFVLRGEGISTFRLPAPDGRSGPAQLGADRR